MIMAVKEFLYLYGKLDRARFTDARNEASMDMAKRMADNAWPR